MEHLNECKRYYVGRHLPRLLIEPDSKSNPSDDNDGDNPITHFDVTNFNEEAIMTANIEIVFVPLMHLDLVSARYIVVTKNFQRKGKPLHVRSLFLIFCGLK